MAEILAPAGGMEQIYAAVRCGADAVYLGAQGFNARRNAANFDEVTLPQAVSYCHARGVKVYVTVNTVILDSELPRLEQEADLIARSGADAVIIQDMAVLQLFASRYPTLERYASTQTAVHNVDGALFLRDLGFDSIVLARELTLKEMEQICSAVKIKTEAFVHGAHCMSVSGACYLSAMIGTRSGNRGLCAQPCRLNWNNGKNGYALSLKDMSLVPHIREMESIGVTSLKIEGRMKRPEYVAAAVTACRDALAGRPYDVDTLRAVFSRSGFSDGYLLGRRDAAMFGARTKEDVGLAQKVLGELAGLYRAETPRVPLQGHFQMDAAGSSLRVQDGKRSIEVAGPVPEKALSRPTDAAIAEKNLKKTGGTPFYFTDLSHEIAPGLMLPVSALNNLRRSALDALLEERGRITAHEAEPFAFKPIKPYSAEGEPKLWARFFRAEQLVCVDKFEKILLPLREISAELISRLGNQLVAELPAVLFPEDEKENALRLSGLAKAGLREVYTDNIYGIELGRRLGLTVRGGACLNITNTEALRSAERCGLASATISFEVSMQKIKALGGKLPRGILAYGRAPLMRLRNCPLRAGIGCENCRGRAHLTDRLGVAFPVECAERRYTTLLNSVPLHIAERDTRGLDYQLLWFTSESRERCMEIVSDFLLGKKSNEPRTGGLYYRDLL